MEDIPALLSLFIEEKRLIPFEWNLNDCCTFSSDWIAMRYGVDPAADVRGKYATALGAARILKERGGVYEIAREFCDARGWAEIKSPMARRGELVWKDCDRGPALGVCCGIDSAFPGKFGIDFVRTLSCGGAWRAI